MEVLRPSMWDARGPPGRCFEPKVLVGVTFNPDCVRQNIMSSQI